MCPACISSMALMVAGVTSTSGVAALLCSRLRRGKGRARSSHGALMKGFVRRLTLTKSKSQS